MTLEQDKNGNVNSSTGEPEMDKTGTDSKKDSELQLQNVIPFAAPGNREFRRKQEQDKRKAGFFNEKHTKLESPEERKRRQAEHRKQANASVVRDLRGSSSRNRRK